MKMVAPPTLMEVTTIAAPMSQEILMTVRPQITTETMMRAASAPAEKMILVADLRE